jgi:hypothetical protein
MSTKPRSRNLRAYVRRDITAAEALNGFMVNRVVGSTPD